jgi:hypothetical protein
MFKSVSALTFAKKFFGTCLTANGKQFEVGRFSIDGQADIHNDPYVYHVKETPGQAFNGKDMPFRADGLKVDASDAFVSQIRVKQMPGKGISISGYQAHGEWLFADHTIGGIVLTSNDGHFSHVFNEHTVGDGITYKAGGLVVDDAHSWGCDVAGRIERACKITRAYHEAARIGTHIADNCDGTSIDGLNVGPATCFEHCVLLDCGSVTLKNITGCVRIQTPEHPKSVGIEIAFPWLMKCVIEGDLPIDYNSRPATIPGTDKTDALILRGNLHDVNLAGGWNIPTDSTHCRMLGDCNGNVLRFPVKADGGCVLDVTQMTGKGNSIRIDTLGSVTPVRGTLPSGNELIVNGVAA